MRISSHFEELESSDSKAAGKIFQGEWSAKNATKTATKKSSFSNKVDDTRVYIYHSRFTIQLRSLSYDKMQDNRIPGLQTRLRHKTLRLFIYELSIFNPPLDRTINRNPISFLRHHYIPIFYDVFSLPSTEESSFLTKANLLHPSGEQTRWLNARLDENEWQPEANQRDGTRCCISNAHRLQIAM